ASRRHRPPFPTRRPSDLGPPPEHREREYRMPGNGLRPLRGRRLDQLERPKVLAPGHPAQQRLPEARNDFGSKVFRECEEQLRLEDRKSTRLNSSHVKSSY